MEKIFSSPRRRRPPAHPAWQRGSRGGWNRRRRRRRRGACAETEEEKGSRCSKRRRRLFVEAAVVGIDSSGPMPPVLLLFLLAEALLSRPAMMMMTLSTASSLSKDVSRERERERGRRKREREGTRALMKKKERQRRSLFFVCRSLSFIDDEARASKSAQAFAPLFPNISLSSRSFFHRNASASAGSRPGPRSELKRRRGQRDEKGGRRRCSTRDSTGQRFDDRGRSLDSGLDLFFQRQRSRDGRALPRVGGPQGQVS